MTTETLACTLCKKAIPDEIEKALRDLFEDEQMPTPEMIICPDCAEAAPDAVLGLTGPRVRA